MTKKLKSVRRPFPRHGVWGSTRKQCQKVNKEAQTAPPFAEAFARDIWERVLLSVNDPAIHEVLVEAVVNYFDQEKVFAIMFPKHDRIFSEMLKNSFGIWGKPFHGVEGIDKVAVMFDGEDLSLNE